MKKITQKEQAKEMRTEESEVNKTGFIRAERSDRSLLRGHVTHLINHG